MISIDEKCLVIVIKYSLRVTEGAIGNHPVELCQNRAQVSGTNLVADIHDAVRIAEIDMTCNIFVIHTRKGRKGRKGMAVLMRNRTKISVLSGAVGIDMHNNLLSPHYRD